VLLQLLVLSTDAQTSLITRWKYIIIMTRPVIAIILSRPAGSSWRRFNRGRAQVSLSNQSHLYRCTSRQHCVSAAPKHLVSERHETIQQSKFGFFAMLHETVSRTMFDK